MVYKSNYRKWLSNGNLLDKHFLKFFSSTMEHIAIYGATDARKFATIGMLPEVPFDVVGWLGDIVVCHPEGILIETLVAKYIATEAITTIYNRFNNVCVCV